MTFAGFLFSFVSVLVLVAMLVVGFFVMATQRIAANAEKQVPFTGKTIEFEGGRIRYVERGSGSPVLFVHGLGGQLHHFVGPIFDHLDRDYRLVAIDRPGSGYSTRSLGASGTLRQQAAALKHVIDVLALDRPLVVGHSLGGAVALALALDSPRSVGGLALIAPLTTYRKDVSPAFASLHMPSRLKRYVVSRTFGIPMALKYARRTLAYVFGPQLPPDDYMIRGGGWLGLRPSHLYATVTDLTETHNHLSAYEARYAELSVPVGILFGSEDQVLDSETEIATLLRALPGTEVEVLDGIGHMPQFSATTRTVAFIERMAGRALLLQHDH